MHADTHACKHATHLHVNMRYTCITPASQNSLATVWNTLIFRDFTPKQLPDWLSAMYGAHRQPWPLTHVLQGLPVLATGTLYGLLAAHFKASEQKLWTCFCCGLNLDPKMMHVCSGCEESMCHECCCQCKCSRCSKNILSSEYFFVDTFEVCHDCQEPLHGCCNALHGQGLN